MFDLLLEKGESRKTKSENHAKDTGKLFPCKKQIPKDVLILFFAYKVFVKIFLKKFYVAIVVINVVVCAIGMVLDAGNPIY